MLHGGYLCFSKCCFHFSISVCETRSRRQRSCNYDWGADDRGKVYSRLTRCLNTMARGGGRGGREGGIRTVGSASPASRTFISRLPPFPVLLPSQRSIAPFKRFEVLDFVQYTRSVAGRQTGNVLWQMATTRHRFSVRDMSAIERRPTHLNECLWRHYFRTRNIVTLLSPVYLCSLRVVANESRLLWRLW